MTTWQVLSHETENKGGSRTVRARGEKIKPSVLIIIVMHIFALKLHGGSGKIIYSTWPSVHIHYLTRFFLSFPLCGMSQFHLTMRQAFFLLFSPFAFLFFFYFYYPERCKCEKLQRETASSYLFVFHWIFMEQKIFPSSPFLWIGFTMFSILLSFQSYKN